LATHYGEDRELRLLQETGDAMRDQIRQIVSQVHHAGDDVGQFGDALDGLENGLGSLEGSDAMKTLVAQMLVATRQMKSKSEQLEGDLKQSANEISNLQQKLEESCMEALTDALTGITNRAGFDKSLKHQISHANQERSNLALVMCDIDHFKKFNDTYGHQLGDQVLKLVGAVMRDSLKGRDIACRYGGEEFALLLPDTNLKGACAVSDALRQSAASKRIVRKSTGEEISRITMSFGVAEYRHGEAGSAMVQRADTALYQSKNDGRNCVTAELPEDEQSALAAVG